LNTEIPSLADTAKIYWVERAKFGISVHHTQRAAEEVVVREKSCSKGSILECGYTKQWVSGMLRRLNGQKAGTKELS
jgi:hypothetical protein